MRLTRCAIGLILLGLVSGHGVTSQADAEIGTPARLAGGDNPTNSLRIALIGLAKANAPVESALVEALNSDSRVTLIDSSIVKPALAGVGYDGSINMSKDEARRLGAAVGCDFFIIGKSETLTRSQREKESHEVAYAGVMFVDGRTGALAVFDFVTENAATREAASSGLLRTLASHRNGYVDRMIEFRRSMSETLRPNRDPHPPEIIEDLPAEDSPRAVGFVSPEFLNRVKPEFTAEAESADIYATVELMVVFRSDGEVGTIEVTQWAGFGLDESAEKAIHQLKFKPATRDGKPVSVRALIRYNFRRVTDASAKPEDPAPKPPEKPERDLRQLFKPTYRRP
jgi:TonB family protein